MNPMMIMALISAAMPILQQMIAAGIEIAKALEAAQGSPAAPAIQAASDVHVAMVRNALTGIAAAIAPKPV